MKKPQIIAVDDDPIFLRILEAALTKFGATVRTAQSPEALFKCLETFVPELYLIDLHLEQSSGYQLIEQIRKKYPKTAIVVISGESSPTAVVNALECGANDFILKPLDRSLLAAKLQRYMPTYEILEHATAPVNAPGESVEATLAINAEISEVDELGIRFVSRNMIPKGTVLKASTLLLAGMQIDAPYVLLTITSTEYDAAIDRYLSYGEYDGVEVDFLQCVRKWLISKGN